MYTVEYQTGDGVWHAARLRFGAESEACEYAAALLGGVVTRARVVRGVIP